MVIPVCKREGSSVVCVATSTCRYDTERGSQRVKQLMSHGFVHCQEKLKVILFLYSLKSFLCPVLGCVATHTSRKKAFTFCKLKSQFHELLILKWKVTCCHMMISCHLPILLLKLKWLHSLVQRLRNNFSER